MDNSAYVVVGVVNDHADAVIKAAATFAERFGAELICATVNPTRYATGIEREDDQAGYALTTASIDPDIPDERLERFSPRLEARIAHALTDRDVRWSVRALAGGPAQELSRLAEDLDAAMIVVGTRESGLGGTLHEFLNGSVAVQLAHRQRRPVVVVPLGGVPKASDV